MLVLKNQKITIKLLLIALGVIVGLVTATERTISGEGCIKAWQSAIRS